MERVRRAVIWFVLVKTISTTRLSHLPSMMMATSGNPLLLSFVSEWLQTERERNAKAAVVYKKAFDSLKACPVTFAHPSEAQQLEGIGPKICDRLTQKLIEHCEQNGLPFPERPSGKRKAAVLTEHDNKAKTGSPPKKARKTKPYVPALRSGAYALIIALSTLDESTPSGLTKSEIIELAQPHSDSSFLAPSDPTKFYTAWNSMRTLMDKDLIYEKGRPLKKYCLTDEGWEVARRIKTTNSLGNGESGKPTNVYVGIGTNNAVVEEDFDLGARRCGVRSEPPAQVRSGTPEIIANGEAVSSISSLPTFAPIILEPGSFKVQLVLDIREVRAKTDRDYMQNELSKAGVQPIMRSLELGDILWIAKLKSSTHLASSGAEGDEVVLDWIVERKRLDDLVGSIKDGRFQEQKFRLRKCGVRNVVYLIEEISMNAEHFQKYEEAVESAIASTQVVNGFFVKKTQKMDDTIRYLARMTLMLRQVYETKPLLVIPTKVITAQNYRPLIEHLKTTQPETDYHITYPAFGSLASKSESLTLRDIFLKMLMCTRGVTGEKALEVQRRWKTPIDLIEAYSKCDGRGDGDEQSKKQQMELVSDQMGHLIGRKKIARTLSMKFAEVWGEIRV